MLFNQFPAKHQINIIYNYILKDMMFPDCLEQISKYLSHSFFLAVQQFQRIIQQYHNKPQPEKKLEVCKLGHSSLTQKKMSELVPGHNYQVFLEIIVLRAVFDNNLTFMLGIQSNSKINPNYNCFIVNSSEIQNFKMEDKVGFNICLKIKQPFVCDKIVLYDKVNLLLCLTKVQNMKWQTFKKDKTTCQQIKNIGNQLFSAKNFYDAMICYEYALTSSKREERKTRSILYANTGACFYQMRLYEQTIRYCNISISIDNNYPKSYFRKINALLQKNCFSQIPALLIDYSMNVQGQNLLTVNNKFTNYITNSRGIFNWHDILKKQASQCSFSNYLDRDVELRQKNSKNIYFSIRDIEANLILSFTKPIYLIKYPKNQRYNLDKIVDQVQSLSILEVQYKKVVQNMGSLKYKSYFDQKDKFLTYVKILVSEQLLECQELQSYKKGQTTNYGLWVDYSNFQHSCEPNCSYVHIKSCLLISSTKKIPKNQPLTIDLAAYQPITNRKNYLKQKYLIDCSCKICQYKQISSTQSTSKQISLKIEKADRLLVMKQMLDKLFSSDFNLSNVISSPNKIFYQITQKYLEMIKTQTHWNDLLELIDLSRNQHVPYQSKMSILQAFKERLSEIFKFQDQKLPLLTQSTSIFLL